MCVARVRERERKREKGDDEREKETGGGGGGHRADVGRYLSAWQQRRGKRAPDQRENLLADEGWRCRWGEGGVEGRFEPAKKRDNIDPSYLSPGISSIIQFRRTKIAL